ncbi:very short patch repair endonuclease [Sinorhizobium medicae]|uniref:very short patch repair endonuclease n=1 Tax=Sinorhizobium medicae TaxID=110321 RepID=UPI00041404F6|nr:very short patch repair endonuclease [Sinorhizobium medicae]RVQ59893.1 DNA mismatch endonuclease Vsr [Sinorhizobium medicae]
MVDVVSSEKRSQMMSGIRGKNTKPELTLRRHLHAAGLRFRLHDPDVIGRPDLLFKSRRAALFVHGCFWHRHEGCYWCTTPASNPEFWTAKFARNKARDVEVRAALNASGWRVGTVWECGLRPTWLALTLEKVTCWIRDGAAIFETELVRPRTTDREDLVQNLGRK